MPTINGDSQTWLTSLYKRVLPLKNFSHTCFKRYIKLFAISYYRTFIPVISLEDMMTPEEWIDSCSNYSEKRKNHFRAIILNLQNSDTKFRPKKVDSTQIDFTVSSFQKLEHYEELAKYLRLINPRSDEAKVFIAPVIRTAEKAYYKTKHFIKEVKMTDRINHIMEQLEGPGSFTLSDFASFESHFDELLMNTLDFTLLRHMFQKFPRSFVDSLISVLKNNVLKNGTLSATFPYVRQSGEMPTALFNGNGASIKMCSWRHLTNKVGTNASFSQCRRFMNRFRITDLSNCKFRFVAEGDDIVMAHETPLNMNFIKLSGINIKIQSYNNVSDAPFVSMVYDEELRDLLYDPKKFCASIGWIDGKYRNANESKLNILLVGKCLSFLHAYPNCPVIAPMAQHYIRSLGHTTLRKAKTYFKAHNVLGSYKQKFLMSVIDKELPTSKIDFKSRLKIEQVFGMTCIEQYRIESFVQSNPPCSLPARLFDCIPADWFEYGTNYTKPALKEELDRNLVVVEQGQHNPYKLLPSNVVPYYHNNNLYFWAN